MSTSISRADLTAAAQTQAATDSQYKPGVLKLSQGSLLYRAVWAVIVIGVCVGCLLHLVSLIDRYQAYPVTTVTNQKTQFYSFPDVTVCPTNFIGRLYGKNAIPSPYAKAIMPRGMHQMAYDGPRFYRMLVAENRSAAMPKDPYDNYRDGRLLLGQIAYRVKQFADPYDMVVFCRFNSEPCTYENFTVHLDEEYLQCMTFKPNNNTVIKAGAGNGFYLVYYSYSLTYLTPEDELNHKSGIRAVVHERGEKPNLLGPTVHAPRGWKADASIKTTIVKKLNRVAAPCVTSLPNETFVTDATQLDGIPRTETYAGSEEDCKNRIRQQEFLDKCGCLASNYPMPLDLYNQSSGICHKMHEYFFFRDIWPSYFRNFGYVYIMQNDTGYYKYMSQYVNDNYHLYNQSVINIQCYHRVLKRQKTQGINAKSCPVLCNKKTHAVKYNVLRWPNDNRQAATVLTPLFRSLLQNVKDRNLTTKDMTKMNENPYKSIDQYIGVIDLFPEKLELKMSLEDWAYPLRNFFSDLGGILGLWMGASVVTIAEAFELFGSLALMLKQRLDRNKKIDRSE